MVICRLVHVSIRGNMRDLVKMSSADERVIMVKRFDLLARLKENRELHLAEYNNAVAGYLEEAKSRLEEQYKKARVGIRFALSRATAELERYDPTEAKDTIVFCKAISFTLTAPRHHVDAYDQAIAMMEWDTRDEVELNATEFRSFVMNKWDWMDEFLAVTSSYKANR